MQPQRIEAHQDGKRRVVGTVSHGVFRGTGKAVRSMVYNNAPGGRSYTFHPEVWRALIRVATHLVMEPKEGDKWYWIEIQQAHRVASRPFMTPYGKRVGVPLMVWRVENKPYSHTMLGVTDTGGRMAKGKSKKGLTAKTFKGLSKKRMEKKGVGGKVLILRPGEVYPVQFLQDPTEFVEYENHVFQEDGWKFVPCAGDDCPLDEDDDNDRSKTSYSFAANVYNLKEKKVQIIRGPKDLAQRIWYRYERNPKKFKQRIFEITKFQGTPVTYDATPGEDQPVSTKGLKLYDLEDYINEELKRYWGDDAPTASALDDDDEDEPKTAIDDDDLEDEEEDDLEDEEDEDDEDEDEDDDWDDDLEDEEDEDEPPAVKSKAPTKKRTAKKRK